MGKKSRKKIKKNLHQELQKINASPEAGLESTTTQAVAATKPSDLAQNNVEKAVYSHSDTAVVELKKFLIISVSLTVILIALVLLENKTHFLLNLSANLFNRFTLPV